MARNHAKKSCCVAHVSGERPDAVKRRRKGDQAVARDASVGGQHAHYAAKAGWLANGTAGIRAQRGHGQVGRHGRRRPAAGAAGNTLCIDRVAHRAVGRIFIGRAHGELVAIQLAQQHRARGFEPGHGRRVIGRHVALKDF